MIGYVYVLHFDRHLAHAGHYVGSTCNLKQRLYRHAHGAGSRICQALTQQGINWTLAALYQTSAANARCVERDIKDKHATRRWCPFCTSSPLRPRFTKPMSLQLLPFPYTSQALRDEQQLPQTITRLAVPSDVSFMLRVRAIMASESNQVGYIPVGTHADSFARFLANGQCIFAFENEALVGYCLFSYQKLDIAQIHQIVVDDGSRLCGHGREMITLLEQISPRPTTLVAYVRDDLPANAFWLATGFTLISQERHKTSKLLRNIYTKRINP